MKQEKPLTDYTVGGLIYLSRNTEDPALPGAIIEELRRRQQAKAAAREAAGQNDVQRVQLDAELEIEGLRSRDLMERRKARRKLHAYAKEQAFDRVPVPDGDDPAEAVQTFGRLLNDKSRELYREVSQAVRSRAALRNRVALTVVRREHRAEKRTVQSRQRQNRRAQLDRLPIIGTPVQFEWNGTCVEGEVTGYGYWPSTRGFFLHIMTPGGRVFRTPDAVEPLANVDAFTRAAGVLRQLEEGARSRHERDLLRARIEVYAARLKEVEAAAGEFEASELRRELGDLIDTPGGMPEDPAAPVVGIEAAVERVFAAVQQATGVSREQLESPGRVRGLVFARMIAAHHLRAQGLTTAQIAQELGGRHRATIDYHLRGYYTERTKLFLSMAARAEELLNAGAKLKLQNH